MRYKQGKTFWKCWGSKFESDKQCQTHIGGQSDPRVIADQFAGHFAAACSSVSVSGTNRLKHEYEKLRPGYKGESLTESRHFDAELVENVILKMKRDKAAGLDGVTTNRAFTVLSCYSSVCTV